MVYLFYLVLCHASSLKHTNIILLTIVICLRNSHCISKSNERYQISQLVSPLATRFESQKGEVKLIKLIFIFSEMSIQIILFCSLIFLKGTYTVSYYCTIFIITSGFATTNVVVSVRYPITYKSPHPYQPPKYVEDSYGRE